MEDPLSAETTSNFSSIAEVPDHLERQYGPLTEVFHTHSTDLPQHGSPDSNSEGEGIVVLSSPNPLVVLYQGSFPRIE